MKAYIVSDRDNESQEIIFADTHAQAKRKSELYGEEMWIDIRAKRAPQYDQYAEQGYVPGDVMLWDGWALECRCYRLQVAETAIVIDGEVYCEKCRPGEAVCAENKGCVAIYRTNSLIDKAIRYQARGMDVTTSD